MQLTIELESATQVATIAHLAEMMNLPLTRIEGVTSADVDPRDTINSMQKILEDFDYALEYIDSPYDVSDEDGQLATILALTMQKVSQHILDLKDEREKADLHLAKDAAK